MDREKERWMSDQRHKETSNDPYKKTEKLLYLYPNCSDKSIMADALNIIKDDHYYGVIVMHYFDGETFESIALRYRCKERTIYYNRKKLVRRLSEYLFADDVVRNILNSRA